MLDPSTVCAFFFFNDTATTEIYTLSLHDALPIWAPHDGKRGRVPAHSVGAGTLAADQGGLGSSDRSEEHTSELQSRLHLVCRLLLEKKKMDTQTLSDEELMVAQKHHCVGDGHEPR